ncbi:MAG: VWA domain-containing protein [Patescibacteria group bacterium]|nr:VWA domain-containing protein [Patescibacteria group bacterium]
MDNPFISARLKQKAEQIKQSHSNFWMGRDAEELSKRVEEGSVEYIEKLRSIQRAIGNFVKIVTNREIPVVFSSGEQSYTDGKQVVISADLDPAGMDKMVGTALHEGAHCLLSNESLAWLKGMSIPDRGSQGGVTPDGDSDMTFPTGYKLDESAFTTAISGTHLEARAKALKLSTKDVFSHVQMVMNVLEDRRIDLWMYQHAAGYRPYYEAMYDAYWHSSKIDAALESPAYHDQVVDNYIMFVINMTNPHWKPVMPGLDDIRKIANITESGLEARGDSDTGWKNWRKGKRSADEQPKLFRDAVKIVEIMYDNSTAVENPNVDKNVRKMIMAGEGDEPGSLPNMDVPSSKEVQDAIARQKKFLQGKFPKKEISEQSKDRLKNLNDTKANVKSVNGDFIRKGIKANVIVYRDVNKRTMASPSFPFSHSYGRSGLTKNQGMETALKNGINMGAILASKLRVMQDEKPLKYTRQDRGVIDKRLISGLGFGQERVFSITHVEKMKPVNVWLDVDFSGSMAGEKSYQAMQVAVAIAYAASKTRMLNCVISVRDSNVDIDVAILYDSRKHKFDHLRNIVPYLQVGGGTPEGLAFEAVKDEMMKMWPNERKYFINFSDGEPAYGFEYKGRYYSYGGEEAYRHVRMMMKEFKEVGIQVLSYYIGNGRWSGGEHAGFRSMYGTDARFIDTDNIISVTNTLNKLLLTGEIDG